MVQGQCKLCLKATELQDSHLLPKALYKRSLGKGPGNPNPARMSARNTIQTSHQIKDYVLCRDCEQLFSRNGESYVMRLVSEGGKFPLLATLQAARPTKVSPVFTWYDHASAPTIDRNKLGYFALSVFWRASVHVWHRNERTHPLIELGPVAEVIRTYLLGESAFPKDVVLMFVACTDALSQNVFYEPSKGNEKQETYTFLARGLNCFMMSGEQVSDPMRTLCGVTGADQWILSRSCEGKVLDAASRLVVAQPNP